MLDNTFTKISEILFAYIQEEVYVCREDSVNTNHHSIFMECIYNHRTTKTNQKYPSVNL